jgi:outer membrane protein OmpA-like peptidoglycan-associated protein
MKSKAILLGTVAAVSIAAASQSQARNQGWYIGLEGGANWVDDNDGLLGINSSVPFFSEITEFDTGWSVLATVGYAFDNNWRIELEGGYRQNDIDLVSLGIFPGTTTGGDLNEITIMANVLYDVPLTDRLDLTFGLGAGVDRAEFQPPAFWGGEDDDWNFAYQGIAGLSYAITNRLDLTLTYRYLHVDEPEFSVPGGPNPTPEHWNFDDLEKHTVTIGLRYDLYEDEAPLPPPVEPPPVPPAAEEPKQFIVYFGFNKCNITPEADQVLSEAASAAKSDGGARVSIVGHTDTVGSDSYNQKLSQCRANAAKSGLVGKGVPADAISTSGRGETDLLVKTDNNVKEPQNRRATIDLE